jgi:flavin-dependent dehydrogenase
MGLAPALVIGAGPAARTRHSSRRARDWTYARRQAPFPRDKICGDAIARKSLGVLRELGIDFNARCANRVARGAHVTCGHRIDVDCPRATNPHRTWCAVAKFSTTCSCVRRARLDVWEDTTVSDIIRDGNNVRGVVCRRDGVDHEVRATMVVGADGFDSVLARRLGFYTHDPRWYVATRGYYRGLDVARETVEVTSCTKLSRASLGVSDR